MKTIMVSILVLLSAAAAWACPGGDIKTLVFNDQVVGEVNLTKNRVKITDSTSQLFYVAHVPENTEIAQMICGSPHSGVDICDYDQGLMIDLKSQPNSTLIVGVLVDTHKEVYFNVTNFRVARGGCGEKVIGIVQK